VVQLEVMVDRQLLEQRDPGGDGVVPVTGGLGEQQGTELRILFMPGVRLHCRRNESESDKCGK
jgi:hypothetical protein